MVRTPTSVIAVSILALVYAALDGLGTAVNLAMFLLKVQVGPGDPMLTFLYHDPLAGIFTVVCSITTVPMVIWLASASIGSLRLRPWARPSMVAYAWTN